MGLEGILNHKNWHQYKIRLLQELNEDINNGRLQFCEILPEKMITYLFIDQPMRKKLIFDTVKKHSCGYCSDTNPRICDYVRIQNQKLTLVLVLWEICWRMPRAERNYEDGASFHYA